MNGGKDKLSPYDRVSLWIGKLTINGLGFGFLVWAVKCLF